MPTNCSSVTEDYLETQKLLELGVPSFSNLPLQEHIGSSQISRFCCVETYAEFCKISHLIKYLLWVVDKRALCCSIIQGSWNHLFPLLLSASSFVCPKMKKVKIVQYKYTNKTDWKCCSQRFYFKVVMVFSCINSWYGLAHKIHVHKRQRFNWVFLEQVQHVIIIPVRIQYTKNILK